jgi:hypothetical protein
MDDFEFGSLVACLLGLSLYHVYLYRKVFYQHSNKIQLSINIQIAEKWVLKHKVGARRHCCTKLSVCLQLA